VPDGPYYVSQLDANLQVEWSFQNTTDDQNHPNGYEWCVNAPVIDVNGLVYITSEDGSIYSVPQGHQGIFTQWQQKIFLLEALGAAYTPLSIGDDGKVYSQNDGNLFVVGQ
jgi:outer membrane protein assembly factor BamB